MVSCQEDEECTPDTCSNGSCSTGSCVCSFGYEGSECNIEQRAKFIGRFTYSENCTGKIFNYISSIRSGNSSVDEVILADFYALPNTEISAIVYGQSITIAEQTITHDGGQYTFQGSGSINGKTLTLSYTVIEPNNTQKSCTSTGVKP